MPYADEQIKRDKQRSRYQLARAAYFVDKVCVECGSTEFLIVRNKNSGTRVNKNLWAWAAARREQTLAECVVMCHPCARVFDGYNVKLTPKKVQEIRTLLDAGQLTREAVGNLYGVSRHAIDSIANGRSWK